MGCSQDDNHKQPQKSSSSALINNIDTTNHYRGDIYQLAKGCYTIHSQDGTSVISQVGSEYQFGILGNSLAISFFFQPSALGEYLLYDNNKNYLAANEGRLVPIKTLQSEMVLPVAENQSIISPAEWHLYAVTNETDNELFQLYNKEQQKWLSKNGLSVEKINAQIIKFSVADLCPSFPEANIAATGEITKTHHEDGTLWGYVDAHEHIMANYGTGGRMMHGAAFHKFGITHALADCEKHHGSNGQYDLINLATATTTPSRTYFSVIDALTQQQKTVPKFNHITRGFPFMDDWDVHTTMTHQQLYYKWIERAYLGGMRLIVEYFESVEVVCEIYQRLVPVAADQDSCNEMDHVDYQ